jgi:ribose transport system substrate-binding protein
MHRWRVIGFAAVAVATAALAATAAAAGRHGGAGKPTVAFVTADSVDPFFITWHCGSSVAAKQFGVSLIWQGTPTFSYQTELSIFNAVMTRNPGAVIVVPFSAPAFNQPARQAAKAGTLVITANVPLAKGVAARTYLTAEKTNGELGGVGLAKQLGGKGKVAIIAPSASISYTVAQRIAGFKAGIAKYPGITLVATEYSGGDSSKAAALTAALLQAQPDLGGIFATDTGSGEGAASALLAAGARGKVHLVAYDASPKEVADLKSGALQGLVAQDPYSYGYQTVKWAAQVLEGKVKKGAPKTITLGGAFIDKNNVNSPSIKKFLYRSTCS